MMVPWGLFRLGLVIVIRMLECLFNESTLSRALPTQDFDRLQKMSSSACVNGA